jgi:multidrug efflux system membrane fusion protein
MKRVVIAVVVVAALGAGGFWFFKLRQAAAPVAAKPERKVPVLVETAELRDVPIVIEGLGTVTPLASVSIHTQVDGRLDSVSFKEGAPVKKGEVIAQIDPRPFRIAVAQTQATLERDLATQRNAKLALERLTGLRAQNLVPQQQVDDQQTLFDSATGTVGIDQALTDNARLQLEYSRIVSPIDALAGIRAVDPGNLVHQSDPTGIVVLTQISPISVIFTLPQDDLERVTHAFSDAPRTVEAWSRDGLTKLATGELKVIDNQITAATATIRLKATFENADRALWPNQFVKARLHVESKAQVLVVSAAAVQRGQQGAFVYVVTPENTVQLKPVEVDAIEGTVAMIRKGLAAGETVVVDGQAQLKPGASVDPRRDAPKVKKVADARSAP